MHVIFDINFFVSHVAPFCWSTLTLRCSIIFSDRFLVNISESFIHLLRQFYMAVCVCGYEAIVGSLS